jgi:cAMP-specific phosphodiesterase 4
VLENHHIAASSAVLNDDQYNIFSKLNPQDTKEIRKRMIHMVLSTDMSKHFGDLGKFKLRVCSDSFDPGDNDKLLTMGIGIHLSDISNPTKNGNSLNKWTDLLFEEFFMQGDEERK